MYHLKETGTSPPGKLDLNVADDEEFSPDKLRSNIERLYMTIVRIAPIDLLVISDTDCFTDYWTDYIW
jgi:hypothetical protein